MAHGFLQRGRRQHCLFTPSYAQAGRRPTPSVTGQQVPGDRGISVAPLTSGQVVTDLRFHPSAAPGVLGVPAYVLRDQRVRLDELWSGTADALGWIERTLHRRCLDAFGYSPLVLRRILRFRIALRLARNGASFAAIARVRATPTRRTRPVRCACWPGCR